MCTEKSNERRLNCCGFIADTVFIVWHLQLLVNFSFHRIMVMENVNKPQLWNIFNQVTMQSQDVRHHRFCLRLMLKNPDNHVLCVLNGHNAFVSGSFKHALGNIINVLTLTNVTGECFFFWGRQIKVIFITLSHTASQCRSGASIILYTKHR